MSKDRVWNKGKHNGRGLAGAHKKPENVTDNSTDTNQAEIADSNAGDTGNPINSVKRMNRENWVVRPSRVTPKSPKKDPQP